MNPEVVWIPEKVVLLELPGFTGWLLPTKVTVSSYQAVFVWELVAEHAMHLQNYRLWFGERWIDQVTNATVSPNDNINVTVTLTRP
jgi:hypothetical protein